MKYGHSNLDVLVTVRALNNLFLQLSLQNWVNWEVKGSVKFKI